MNEKKINKNKMAIYAKQKFSDNFGAKIIAINVNGHIGDERVYNKR